MAAIEDPGVRRGYAAPRTRTAPTRLNRRSALLARLRALRGHDLRHTCAALSLASPGANLATVKDRLGHENIATTVDLYGKRVASVDAALANAVGASIWVEPEPENVRECARRRPGRSNSEHRAPATTSAASRPSVPTPGTRRREFREAAT